MISNYHVVKDAAKVQLLTGLRRDEVASATQAGAGMVEAKVVQVDAADDLALLKADGRFAPLPILPSKTIQLGGTVATIGFPDPGLQGFAPKLARIKRKGAKTRSRKANTAYSLRLGTFASLR